MKRFTLSGRVSERERAVEQKFDDAVGGIWVLWEREAVQAIDIVVKPRKEAYFHFVR